MDQVEGGKPRILLFSHKNIYDQDVWRCPFREFERILQEVDSVDVLAPEPTKHYPRRKSFAMKLGEFVNVPINPGIPTIRVTQEYDLCITVCEKVSESLALEISHQLA